MSADQPTVQGWVCPPIVFVPFNPKATTNLIKKKSNLFFSMGEGISLNFFYVDHRW